MTVKQSTLYPIPARARIDESGFLGKELRQWLVALQTLLPLIEVDTSAGPVTIALPAAGLNPTTGQSAQNQELVYIKTTADANAVTINGALSGSVALAARWDVARFKSDGTNWVTSCCVSAAVAALVLETNGAVNGSQALLNLIAGSNITLTDDGAGGITIAAAGASAAPTFFRNWHGVSARAASVINSQPYSLNSGNLGFGGTTVNPSATEPPYFAGATTSVLNNQALIRSDASNLDIKLGSFRLLQTRLQLVQLTQIRIWVCLASAQNLMVADSPGPNIVGFRYATSAGDTTWRTYANGVTGPVVHNTGIPPDPVNGHDFAIVSDGAGTIKFYIDQVLVDTINGTPVPALSTALTAVVSVDNDGVGQIRNLNCAYLYYDTI